MRGMLMQLVTYFFLILSNFLLDFIKFNCKFQFFNTLRYSSRWEGCDDLILSCHHISKINFLNTLQLLSDNLKSKICHYLFTSLLYYYYSFCCSNKNKD